MQEKQQLLSQRAYQATVTAAATATDVAAAAPFLVMVTDKAPANPAYSWKQDGAQIEPQCCR